MDGNGRWATARGLSRLIGHTRGAGRVKDIVKSSPELGVTTLTLYAFSTENWKRAAYEIEGLMKLFRGYMQNNLLELQHKNVRVRFLGDPTPLTQDICVQMEQLEEHTKNNTGLNLNIAINYGGRDELVRAVRKISGRILNENLTGDSINESLICENLDTGKQQDPDLIIRTAGELRLSNFLTWQSAYSEFIFLDESWPEFTFEIYEQCVARFTGRVRQYGAVI